MELRRRVAGVGRQLSHGIRLQSIRRIAILQAATDEMEAAFDKGLSYWLTNFFLEDGTPKYYDDKMYPIDIHSGWRRNRCTC